MTVLVTGASGFIGNHLIQLLLKKGHTVVATSTNELKAKSFDWYQKVSYKEFELGPQKTEVNLFNFFGNPDLLIHLAWRGLPNYDELYHLKDNLISQFFFLENLINGGLKDLLITGSCLEYGMQNGCLNESMETKPINSYGVAKDTLRKLMESLQLNYTFSLKWVRLFYMYGEGQSSKSLFSQLNKAIEENEAIFNMSAGEQIRDFLPVKKVIEIIYLIAIQNEVQGVINCCSGKPVSVRKLVEDYLKEKKSLINLNLGYYPYPTYEPLAFWGDSKKINSIT